MWLFTLDGFYSVVAHREEAGVLVVRARDRGDMVRLVDRLDPKPEWWYTPENDYHYRTFVGAPAFADYLAKQGEDIDYTNFKDAVGRIDPERAHVYLDVWTAMWRGLREARWQPRWGQPKRRPKRRKQKMTKPLDRIGLIG